MEIFGRALATLLVSAIAQAAEPLDEQISDTAAILVVLQIVRVYSELSLVLVSIFIFFQ